MILVSLSYFRLYFFQGRTMFWFLYLHDLFRMLKLNRWNTWLIEKVDMITFHCDLLLLLHHTRNAYNQNYMIVFNKVFCILMVHASHHQYLTNNVFHINVSRQVLLGKNRRNYYAWGLDIFLSASFSIKLCTIEMKTMTYIEPVKRVCTRPTCPGPCSLYKCLLSSQFHIT